MFISHSSANNAEAIAIDTWMASHGWDDVFLDLDAAMKEIHVEERQRERDEQTISRKSISFYHAKATLADDRAAEPRPIHQAPAPVVEAPADRGPAEPTAPTVSEEFQQAAQPDAGAPSRADEIKRDMEAWRERNGDKDIGREP